MTDRGQTVYDYLLGVILVLVTIVVVLSLFPQVFGPFVDPVSSDRDEMGERIAMSVIETNGTTGGERTLDLDSDAFDDDYIDSVRSKSGVPEFQPVNVTLQTPDETLESGGNVRPPGTTTATTTRIVTVSPDSSLADECNPGCYLTVRVW